MKNQTTTLFGNKETAAPSNHTHYRAANTLSLKKTVLGGMLVALTVALSGFSVPIGASRCFPIQHFINVIAGVFLIRPFIPRCRRSLPGSDPASSAARPGTVAPDSLYHELCDRL